MGEKPDRGQGGLADVVADSPTAIQLPTPRGKVELRPRRGERVRRTRGRTSGWGQGVVQGGMAVVAMLGVRGAEPISGRVARKRQAVVAAKGLVVAAAGGAYSELAGLAGARLRLRLWEILVALVVREVEVEAAVVGVALAAAGERVVTGTSWWSTSDRDCSIGCTLLGSNHRWRLHAASSHRGGFGAGLRVHG